MADADSGAEHRALSGAKEVYLTTAFSKNSGLNFDTSAVSFINGYWFHCSA
jgi:hypothetical protein